jgi:hypothetical protein
VHGIDGDDAAAQAEFAEQTLDSRDLIGFVLDLDMAQDERAADLEGAHQVTGLLVGEVIEAAAQGFAIEGDHTQALECRIFPQNLAMQAENPLDLGRVQSLA